MNGVKKQSSTCFLGPKTKRNVQLEQKQEVKP